MQELVKMCPVNRQTLLFSATMTHDVTQVIHRLLRLPPAFDPRPCARVPVCPCARVPVCACVCVCVRVGGLGQS